MVRGNSPTLSPASLLDHVRCLVWEAEIREGRGGELEWTPEVRNPEGAARFLPLEVRPGESYTEAWLRSRDREDQLSGAVWSEQAIRSGQAFTLEYRCTRADGSIRWLREDVDVEPVGPGRWRAVGAVTDITDRKRGEELRANVAKVVEATSDFVVTTDTRGRLLYANGAMRRLLGIPERAELRASSHSWLDAQILEVGIPAAVREGIWRGEASLTGARGRTVQVSAVITGHRSGDGRVQSVSIIARDITERKRMEDALRAAEARFRVIAEAAPVGIFLADPSGATLYVNPEGLRQADLERGAATGDGWMRRIHPDDREAVKGEWSAAMRERRPYAQAYRLLRGDGTVVWVEVTAAPVWDGDRLVGYVGASTDVTGRRDLEEQLRHLHKMEAVGRLAGGIAHDFNNVLAVVNGYADLLLRDLTSDDPAYEPLTEIRKAGERASSLTRQLLAYSRRQVLKPEHLDLNAAVENLTGMLRRVLGEDIRLEFRRHPRPVPVFADVGQIEQVILNLAVNARDAMRGGGSLRIAVDEVERETAAGRAPGRYALLTVSDTGTGIPEAALEHIFEPFFTTKPVGEGTGLGLSTVYGIVRQSGGDIEVETGPGGTTFRTYLPRTEGSPEAPRPREKTVPPRGSGRVLIVEDEQVVRGLARRVLERYGYEVVEASGGAEALERLREGAFVVLVTDVIMPEMSGPQLVERARALHPSLPVLFMTGYAEEQLPGLTQDGCSLIRKPFTPAALGERLALLIQGRSDPAP